MKKLTLLITVFIALNYCSAVPQIENATFGKVYDNNTFQADTVDYGSCQAVPSGSPCFFGLYSFWITKVSFGTLNFTGGTCSGDGSDDGYQDLYGADSGSVKQDSTYIFSVTRSGSSGGGFFSAWVDWNNDGDFADTTELLFTVSGATGAITRTFSVAVPVNAVIGAHRLRVRSDGSDPGGNPNPCATAGPYGDTKDFLLDVTGSPLLVNEADNQQGFSISPNPAKDELNLFYPGMFIGIKKIVIYNVFGQVAHTINANDANRTDINIAKLTPGIYYIRILTGQDQFLQRFVKE